jgi:MarR family transcriptional regulator for hemolysin
MQDMKFYDFTFQYPPLTTFNMLRQAWIAVNKLAETKLLKLGLTPEKLAVLWACRDHPGTLIPAEIARLVFRENQTIAGLLNRMEAEGLVIRVPKKKGHPFTEIKMTSKGEKLVGPGIEIMKSIITEVAGDLPVEQQEQLQKTLKVIRDKALEKMHIEAQPPSGLPAGKPIPVKW